MEFVKEYFRQRRLSRMKVYISQSTVGTNSRHILTRFFLTCFVCFLFSAVFQILLGKLPTYMSIWVSIPLMIVAVDVSDAIWFKIYEKIGKVYNILSLAFVIGGVAIASLVINKSPAVDMAKDWWAKKKLESSVRAKDKKQNKIKLTGDSEGDNWVLFVNDQDYLEAYFYKEALKKCEELGDGFRLPKFKEIDKLKPFPEIESKKPVYIWGKGNSRYTLIKKATSAANYGKDNYHSNYLLCFSEESLSEEE